jgi:hypothetical protein
MCVAIALKLWTCLKMVAIYLFLEELCPLNFAILRDFTVFQTFLRIVFSYCIWLYIYDLQIKLEDGFYRPIFGRVMPLELSHFKGFYSFPGFFPQVFSYCIETLYVPLYQ